MFYFFVFWVPLQNRNILQLDQTETQCMLLFLLFVYMYIYSFRRALTNSTIRSTTSSATGAGSPNKS